MSAKAAKMAMDNVVKRGPSNSAAATRSSTYSNGPRSAKSRVVAPPKPSKSIGGDFRAIVSHGKVTWAALVMLVLYPGHGYLIRSHVSHAGKLTRWERQEAHADVKQQSPDQHPHRSVPWNRIGWDRMGIILSCCRSRAYHVYHV